MKFVVNRVGESSTFSTNLLSGLEVNIYFLAQSGYEVGYCAGVLSDGYTCNAFTISEIDDEGYLM